MGWFNSNSMHCYYSNGHQPHDNRDLTTSEAKLIQSMCDSQIIYYGTHRVVNDYDGARLINGHFEN